MVTHKSLIRGLKGIEAVINEISSLVRTEWVAAMSLALIAMLVGGKVSNDGLLLALGIGIGYAFGFALNDYFDRSYDDGDESKSARNLFVKREIGSKFILILGFLSIVVLFFIFSRFGRLGLEFLILSLFVSWAYSAKPLRFKSRPGFDLIVHSLFLSTYPYFMTVVLLDLSWTNLHFAILLVTSLFSLGNQLENQLKDFRIDKLNDTNFTTLVGYRNSLILFRFSSLILLLSSMSLLIWLPRSLWPVLLFVSPVLVERVIRNENWNPLMVQKLKTVSGFITSIYLLIILF